MCLRYTWKCHGHTHTYFQSRYTETSVHIQTPSYIHVYLNTHVCTLMARKLTRTYSPPMRTHIHRRMCEVVTKMPFLLFPHVSCQLVLFLAFSSSFSFFVVDVHTNTHTILRSHIHTRWFLCAQPYRGRWTVKSRQVKDTFKLTNKQTSALKKKLNINKKTFLI